MLTSTEDKKADIMLLRWLGQLRQHHFSNFDTLFILSIKEEASEHHTAHFIDIFALREVLEKN